MFSLPQSEFLELGGDGRGVVSVWHEESLPLGVQLEEGSPFPPPPCKEI